MLKASSFERVRGIPITIVAFIFGLLATGFLTLDLLDLLANSDNTMRGVGVTEILRVYVPIYVLIWGACMHMVARFGYFRRDASILSRKIEPPDDRDAPSLTILVPSYKEEPDIIYKTLMSAALVEYPGKQVVLLIDNPPIPTSAEDRRALGEARRIVDELQNSFHSVAVRLERQLEQFNRRQREGECDPATEARRLARLHRWSADVIDKWSKAFTASHQVKALDHADRFFLEDILQSPAQQHRRRAVELTMPQTIDAVAREYRYLAWLFRVEFKSFERKRYVNLSHAPNKAMNLNSYIALIGKSLRESPKSDGLYLEQCDPAVASLVVPSADYIISLDADTLLLREYALRLIDIIERPENARLAVVQTPYVAFPGARVPVERIAAATMDVYYMTHQGMTHFDATHWVGANALARFSALEEIAIESIERGHKIKIYIDDKTMIEDTAATIDLVSRNWKLFSFPARLAFSATPPDFGSLLIQRRRWANGGLLILPKLGRYLLGRPLARMSEGALRTHYMAGQAIESVAIVALILSSIDDRLFSIWMPLAAAPYQFLYAVDLTIAGYKYSDVARAYALNLLLAPIRIGGTLQSVKQACTGRKQAFGRTPKVAERTATPILYLVALYGLALSCLCIVIKDTATGRAAHAAFAFLNGAALFYGLWRYIGFGAALEDVWAGVWSRGRIVWQKLVASGKPVGASVMVRSSQTLPSMRQSVTFRPQDRARNEARTLSSIGAGDADSQTHFSMAD